jgi:hypothetical protein
MKVIRLLQLVTAVTWVVCAGAESHDAAADYYVWDLPGVDKSKMDFPVMHAGYELIELT